MDAVAFRATLDDLGLSQSAFARLLRQLGDPGDHAVILRRVQRQVGGESKVAGETIALLTLLSTCPPAVRASLIDAAVRPPSAQE
ncbi:MAG: hypothetical protein WDN25_29940 [Acetobacteraceae bacterium]